MLPGHLDKHFILHPPGEFDARDVDCAPEDVARPEGNGQANEPPDEKTQAVLEIGLLAGDFPDIRHERVAQGMQDRSVYDVKGKGDFA
ncbi:hypothetical protein GCM10025794_37960 [Massilia kyonggiensis]